MSVKSSITNPVYRAYEFKGSLARNIVIFMLMISLIPLILVGSSTLIRTRQVLLENAEVQMNLSLDEQEARFLAADESGNTIIRSILDSESFQSTLENYLNNPDDTLVNQRLLVLLENAKSNLSTGDNITFDQVSVFNTDGIVVASSDPTWQNANFGINEDIDELLQFKEQHSYVLFDPSPMYSNEMVLFITTPIDFADNLILVATYIQSFSSSSIQTSNTFYPNATSYFLMQDTTLVGIDSLESTGLRAVSLPAAYKSNLLAAMDNKDSAGFASYLSANNVEVLGTVKNIGDLGFAIILELPEENIYQQVSIFGPINFLLFAASLIICGILLYFVSSRMITPIVRLSEHARDFALGDWNQRAIVNRNDEIGLLAHSFNQMVEQITDLYYSLEQKVENRTEQLGIASEVMQIVTSSTQREELLMQSATLLADRFHYTYVSIYLVDAQGDNAVLQYEIGNSSDYFPSVRPRVRLGTDSIISLSIDKKAIQSHNLEEETPEKPLPQSARHEACIPIAFANNVLGSIYLQSPKHQPFDEELLPILQTISNQIASGIQSTLLLESAQIDLEETTLLYRASRQITQAQSVDEATEILQDTLEHTSYLHGIFFRKDSTNLATHNLFDPTEPWRKSRFADSVNVEKIVEQLVNSNMILLEDLSTRSEYDSVLAYFIQYNCSSASIFPIKVNNQLTIVVVLGSRNPKPMTETTMQPYANLIEVVTSSLERLAVLSTLEIRAKQLQTTAEIARDTSASLDINELLRSSINLIRDRFGFYHASVFLLDQFDEFAELRESTGEAGKVLKEKKHKLPVGSQSVVGQATATNKPQIINDVTITENYYPNPLLPDTRSELAIPLSIGSRVLGAIDVQSYEKNAFKAEDVQILQILSDQLATAVMNATLFSQTIENLRQYRFLQEITTKVGASGSPEEAIITTITELKKALPDFQMAVFTELSPQSVELKASSGLSEEEEQGLAVVKLGEGIVGEAAQKREFIYVEKIQDQDKMSGYRSELAAPILYQNRLLGILYARTENPVTERASYQDFFQALVSSLGSILSNSDLIQRIRIQIERQKLIYDVTTKIRRSVDFETILQTSATEIGKHLGAIRSRIIIHPEIKELAMNLSDNGDLPTNTKEVF
jgi:GAF domain-containing protein/HAMP domain-containing protein